MVPEGGSAKLICKARGYPKPRIVWRREDGATIVARGTGGSRAERLTSVEGEMLSLTKVTRSEMGAYLCIAANGVPPSVSKRMMLHVHCEYTTNDNTGLAPTMGAVARAPHSKRPRK